MPAGACVIRYEGKRGRVWRIKFVDASGAQGMETVGPERDGWTKRKAQSVLRARLVEIERRRYVKPSPETFATFANGWVDRHCDSKGLKESTRQAYRLIVDGHLLPAFGGAKLGTVDVET